MTRAAHFDMHAAGDCPAVGEDRSGDRFSNSGWALSRLLCRTKKSFESVCAAVGRENVSVKRTQPIAGRCSPGAIARQ